MSVRRIAQLVCLPLSFQAFGLGFSLEQLVTCSAIIEPPPPIPITVLSGFLGSGKTSLLQNLLQNHEGLRIAVIVNDVAAVNIDSKLVSSNNLPGISTDNVLQGGSGQPAGIVQLQNGCACCSLSDELLGSVSELVLLSDMRGDDFAFDHIVVELSGISDPKGVRAKFQEALAYDMPLMDRVRLDTMVTLIDCSVYLSHLSNSKLVNRKDSPELYYSPGQVPATDEFIDRPDWAEDLPMPLLEALLAGQRVNGESGDDHVGGVIELLVSQTEIADVCLLNKIDLCSENELRQIMNIVKALNPRTAVHMCQFGNIPLSTVLAVAGGKGVVESGVVDDHKDAVKAAAQTTLLSNQNRTSGHEDRSEQTLDTAHSHGHDHEDISITNHYLHSHNDHSATATSYADLSHEHKHEHEHTASDQSEPHEHKHSHNHAASSSDDVAKFGYLHSHNHEHGSFGLGSFVYRARRPFHPGRIASFLRTLPISRGVPDVLDDKVSGESSSVNIQSETAYILQQVLRSKGFVWYAHSDVAAFYWSHAGISFELSCLGRWWVTLGREYWPLESISAILSDYVSDQMIKADPSLQFVGDRRQEIVFIGTGVDSLSTQESISTALDQCLLDDEEWKVYCNLRGNERALQSRFPNTIETKVLTY